ncbi:Oidioi.mRNA.OKI2018_I69.chr2.g7856.t1.cds [Oikopleura dioica]|uniref:Bifunctional lysine-specific demethylase and histidyl-hydroxylase n=1 Tax=Oikopleura dioica TaxID=34765 RepID=A0ABN7T7I2_OIKDI|nr:Oidioi.mRNA.OKI2018_I69.chr2.g7856.t1.cds [Oikopleura dioica]
MGKKRSAPNAGSSGASVGKKSKSANNAELKKRLEDNGIFQSKKEKILKDFLYPVSESEFFSSIYEKTHKLFIRPKLASNASSLFNKERFEAISKTEQLTAFRDFTLLRNENGESTAYDLAAYDGTPKDFVAYANVMRIVNDEGYTLDFNQPQRFCDDLWRVIADLEETFQSLVGAKVRISPAKSKPLPPVFNSTDSFIQQLNGKSSIKLWKASEIDLPPEQTIEEFREDEMRDADETLVLSPGDMLYIPRGAVFSSTLGVENESSTFIQFTTNNQNTVAQWLNVNFSTFLDKAAYEARWLREAVSRSISTNAEKRDYLKGLLLKLAESVSDENVPEEDPMRKDFFAHRLPPYKEPKTFGKMKSFDLNCSVRLSTKKHIYIFEDDHDDDNADEIPELVESDFEDEPGNNEENGKNGGEMSEIERIAGNMPKEGDMEEDNKSDLEPESEEEAEVFLLHSWQNERRTHMIRQRIIA